MTWIKICGLTREQDILTAVRNGANAVGAVVNAPSSRSLDLETASRILARGRSVCKVIVTMDNKIGELAQMAAQTGADAIQIHGYFPSPRILELRKELDGRGLAKVQIFKSVGVDQERDLDILSSICREFSRHADAIILDSPAYDGSGGTGAIHDWEKSKSLCRRLKDTRMILAGGLNPSNVGEAISLVQPFGVDVSTGVESGPATKDPELISAFIDNVRRQSG